MKNYLIIGGGIAGVTIAHKLLERGISFDLVDNSLKYNSSKVAAGFWNPIVFKRLTMSYNADKLMPQLARFYSQIESRVGESFVHKTPQLKIFSSKEERHRFIDKAIVSEVSQFLDEEVVESVKGIKAAYGMGKVIGTGYIDTVKYINQSIKHFIANDSFIEARLDNSELKWTDGGVEYRGEKYANVIFCEGYHAVDNPLFPELKLKPTKGELLIIEVPELIEDYAFAKSAGLIPIGNHRFVVGSTYDWEDQTEATTEAAKKKLLYNISDFLELDYTVVDQQAGIRPSSYDRRPIIGKSSIKDNAFIMNGLGTKGIIYAPYYSEMLINCIKSGADIDEEVDYTRM